jgi:hypothetical protein
MLHELNINKFLLQTMQKLSLLFTPLLFVLCAIIVFNPIQTFSQPNKLVPVEGGKGGDGRTNANDNNADGVKNFTPQQIDEIREAKNIWKSDLADETEESTNKLMVNYDSLYSVYNGIRKSTNYDEKYIYKVYSNDLLARIFKLDTNLYKCITVQNKYYASFKVENEKMTDKMRENLELIDQSVKSYNFKTAEVFNKILPPFVFIDGLDTKPADYEKFITNFFGNNPELIYLCSKKFVRFITLNQYGKLMALHKTSTNKLDFRNNPDDSATKTK